MATLWLTPMRHTEHINKMSFSEGASKRGHKAVVAEEAVRTTVCPQLSVDVYVGALNTQHSVCGSVLRGLARPPSLISSVLRDRSVIARLFFFPEERQFVSFILRS